MVKLLLLLVLCSEAWCSNVPAIAGRISVNYSDADLWASSFSTSGAKVPVIAYRATGFTLQPTPYKPECQLWLSYGYPEVARQTLKSNTLNRQPTIFHFSPSGFSMDIKFLGESQKVDLAKAAAVKYNCSIAADQVGRLLPSRINCSIQLYDTEGFVLKGEVADLRVYPYSVLFNLSIQEKNTSMKILRSLNDPAGEVDELRNIVCDADFHAGELNKQYWALQTALKRRFTLSVRKTNYILLDEGETGTDSSENLESDCPAFRKKPWRNVISYQNVPRAASIDDCTALHYTQADGTTIALYENLLNRVEWHEAKELCESVGWKLARLTTDNLWNSALLVASRPTLTRNHRIWVGAHLESDSRWRWYNTSSVLSRHIWCENNPISGETVSLIQVPPYVGYKATCLYGEASGDEDSFYFMCTEN